MKRFILEMLQEANGGISTTRVMAFYSLIMGSLIALYGLHQGSDLTGLSALCSVFVGAAFAGKVIQRHVEKKDTK